MHRDRVLIRRVLQFGTALAAVMVCATSVAAQQAVFAGKVTSEKLPGR